MPDYSNRGREIVLKKYIGTYLKRNPKYTGVELEYPVISNGGTDIRKASSGFLQCLVEKHGFIEKVRGTDGLLVRIQSPDGDCITFELHYGHIEFSMWYDENLQKIAERFYNLFKLATEYFSKCGFIITGMGTNLKTDFNNLHFVTDSFTKLIRAYLSEYTYFKKDNCLVTNMFSTQTHLEVDGKRLLDCINMMNKLDFVRGLLFANSLPHQDTLPPGKNYPEGTLCARDFNWKYNDHHSINCLDKELQTIEELVEFIAGLEFICDIKNGELVPIKKISINKYFEIPDNLEENFECFRMFTNTALNHYGTLEIRDDCTQPVSDAFAPSAFHLGIVSNIDTVTDVTNAFFHDNKITVSNSVLREMTVTGQKIVNDDIMIKFLYQLYKISYESLVKRGFGEENLITCLENRIETLTSPALFMKEQLKKGVSLDEMILLYGLVK